MWDTPVAAHDPNPRRRYLGQLFTDWAAGLGKTFRRVAVFRVEGVHAKVASVSGMGPPPLGTAMSLVEHTPLRWAVEAASPIIGSGSAPGGTAIAACLGLSPPRAFAVIPLVVSRRLVALAYVDQAHDPMPLAAASDLFAYLGEVLARAEAPVAKPAPAAAPNPPAVTTPARVPEAAAPQRAPEPPPVLAPPPALPPSEPPRKSRARRRVAAGAAATSGLLLPLYFMAPAGPPGASAKIDIPPAATVSEIADTLHAQGLLRSPTAFLALTRVSGFDRNLRAGTYDLPAGVWAWSLLAELHHGQQATRTVTVPEGLTLNELAQLLERDGFARAKDVLRAARDPRLIAHYGIPAASLDGFLFPETYNFARAVSAEQIVSAMVEQFYARVAHLPAAQALAPKALHAKVTLAAIVQRETREPEEMPRIAGVFVNRLERNMKLESCATVQFVLGRTKERLTLSDVRKPSPYNTYLHAGLPPGPIASPGEAALSAVMAPERHDYLFFFAREDGSHRHVFSKTYTEHQRRQRLVRESPSVAAVELGGF